ncbi:MAG: hypothetical protein ACREFY_12600 [Acetobacteraceae bacterium]
MRIGVIAPRRMGGTVPRRLATAGHRRGTFESGARPVEALAKTPQSRDFLAFIQGAREGRVPFEAAIREAVAAHALPSALYARFRPRHGFGVRMFSATRVGFRGHIEGNEPADPKPQPSGIQSCPATRSAVE